MEEHGAGAPTNILDYEKSHHPSKQRPLREFFRLVLVGQKFWPSHMTTGKAISPTTIVMIKPRSPQPVLVFNSEKSSSNIDGRISFNTVESASFNINGSVSFNVERSSWRGGSDEPMPKQSSSTSVQALLCDA